MPLYVSQNPHLANRIMHDRDASFAAMFVSATIRNKVKGIIQKHITYLSV